MKPTLLHALVPLTYFANDSCWWLAMFANFFITSEKAKKKVGSAPPRTALQKTYKKYFEKRCRKVSTSSLLAGVLVVGSGNFSLCNYRSTFQSSSSRRTFLYETIIIVTLRLGRRVQLLPNFLDKSQLCLTASQHESQNNS